MKSNGWLSFDEKILTKDTSISTRDDLNDLVEPTLLQQINMRERKILIIGTHPIIRSILPQYEEEGCRVDVVDAYTDEIVLSAYDELLLLPEALGNDVATDHATLALLERLSSAYEHEEASAGRPLCHVLLYSHVMLWLLQTLDIYKEVNRKFEVYLFTIEDQWAKDVICGVGKQAAYPPLDRRPMAYSSNDRVHLVVFGCSGMSEALVMHAALTAHYPNYVRDHTLRTRITVVDNNASELMNVLTQRYQSLFDHSYYRLIDAVNQRQALFHRPLYSATREDFVDVEWEFIVGDIHTPAVREKLTLWAGHPHELLTIALCHASHDRNFNEAFAMPEAVADSHSTLLVYVDHADVMSRVQQSGHTHIHPFGMTGSGYDVRLPLLQMAKRLHYFYECSFGQKGTPTDLPADEVEKSWQTVSSFNMRYANLYNVMTIPTKMRSLGHDEREWDTFYALNKEEIDILSAVEHNRWSVERMILGYRPPTDSERLEIKNNIQQLIADKAAGCPPSVEDMKAAYKRRKVHYDLCAYQELTEDKTGQNVRVYDYDLTACIPLIANSFNEQQQ